MNRRKLWKKVMALAVGLLATCVLIEIGLRIGGRFLHDSPKKTAMQIAPNARYLIVCAGDSHTAGIGAPEGQGYPAQLGALFKQTHGSEAIQVINLGDPGDNSSETVNRLKEFLAHSKKTPDLVIFQAGKNNNSNFRQASIITDASLEDDYRTWAKYLLANSRTYRLSQISIERLSVLAEKPDDAPKPRWNDFLNVKGRHEKTLLKQWMLKDIEAAWRLSGENLLLLNYYLTVDWVDDAYREASETWNIPVVDVHYFGKPRLLVMPDLDDLIALPDLHPNQKGYGRIAQKVFDAIARHRLLPLEPEPANQ